ncbi:MAG: YhcH/YjgK/YiaL family protein [Oscillospiraceae bacterium]|nr:YhcH/YjgK/YiaL family protein [Oscillospiraceae bacterium]
MIYDTLNHWKQYEYIHPGVTAGLAWLANTELSALADGRYEVDGDNVFVNVMSYTTLADNPTPERHEKFADIFYLLEGEELVGVCPREQLGDVVKADPAGDVWLHQGETVKLPLGKGRFAVLFPGDGHAPSIGPNGPAPARKCVVKVRL